MDTPPVTLGPAEQRRLYVLTELLAGRLTAIEAALSLGVAWATVIGAERHHRLTVRDI